MYFLEILENKNHYFSTALSWICVSYFPAESHFYNLKQCHNQKVLVQELQYFLFASSPPLTTKRCDRYMLTVGPFIDLFTCLEACCHVTLTNPNCNCHGSTAVTSILTIERQREFRQICHQLLCVKCAVLIPAARFFELVGRERQMFLILERRVHY